MARQTVRLPEQLAKRLEQLASATNRSKNSHIVEALERHLDKLRELGIDLNRFRDPGPEWLEHDDMSNEFEAAYKEMADDENREAMAEEWSEGLIEDPSHLAD